MPFFELNLDYVYFLSGLAFLGLGVIATVLTLERDRSAPWWLLGIFGSMNGVSIWAAGAALDLGDTPVFLWLRLAFRALALLSLFEFGRATLARGRRDFATWRLTATMAAVVAGSAVFGSPTADAVARIAVGLPAGVLAFLACEQAARANSGGGSRRNVVWPLRALGLSVAAYAIGGAIFRYGIVDVAREASTGLFGFPQQGVYALLGLAAATAILVYSTGRMFSAGSPSFDKGARARLLALPVMLAVVAAGGYVVAEGTNQADRVARANLAGRAVATAASVDLDHLEVLTARSSDELLPDYRYVRAELEKIHAANADVRFMYLMRLKDGRAAFLVDSRAVAPKEVSAPGDVYTEASPALLALLSGRGDAFVEGPSTDAWGEWVTAFAPVRAENGTIVAVLGMDIPYERWVASLVGSRTTAIAFIIVACTLMIGFFAAYQVSRDGSRRLTDSEARLRAILSNSPEGVIIVDPGSRLFKFTNPRFAEMIGATGADLLETPAPEPFDEGEPGATSVTDRHLVTRDGRELDVVVTRTPIEMDERRMVLSYVRDVTAQKAAERDLQDRITLENIIRAVSSRFLAADASDVGVVVSEGLATLGTFLEVDRAYLASVSRDRLVTRTREWCAPGVPPLADQMRDITLDGFPWFCGQLEANEPVYIPALNALPPEAAAERVMLASQGVRSRIVVPMTENGRLVGYLTLDNVREEREWSGERIALLTVFSDILAVGIRRAKAENELAKLTMAITNSPAATVITDVDGNIEYVNPRFRELSGYSGAELIGENPRILKSGEMDEAVYEELWRVIASGGDWRGEFVNRRKDGTHYAVTASISPVRDFAGLVHYVCVQEDITALKIAEEELRRAVETAEAANHAKSDFLATMSHEIRTPMNAIIGMAELLDDTPLNEEQQRYIRIFRSAGESLLTLINDILDLSKIEAGHFEMEVSEFDVEQLIEETAEVLAMRAREKGVELLVDIEPGVPAAMLGDPHRLRQVLVNLMGNAIKFTSIGHVLLAVAPVQAADVPSVRFSVSDTGIGIPPAKLETIFEAFTQADSSTTRKYGGTGLGLTISRRLVELMGGRLTAESAVAEGSTFSFTLPASEMETTPIGGEADDRRLAGLRALVVDDGTTNRLILRRYLEQAGATVDEAADGPAGIECLHAAGAHYDIVLTDLRMPEMSGFDVTAAIAADPRSKGTPVVILSSDARPGDSERAVEAGAAALLVKPVRRRALLDVVASILRPGEVVADTPAVAEPPVPSVALPPADAPVEALDILLVEDSEDNRLLVLAYLKATPHRVVSVENGEQAIEAYKSAGPGAFDLVLMDMQMPVMDGYAATHKIREIEKAMRWSHTRIIALTAYALAEETTAAIDAGCDDYLTKPIKKATLLDAVARHTGA